MYFKNKNFIKDLKNKTIFYRYNKDKIHGHHPDAFKNLKKIISSLKEFNLADPIAKCKNDSKPKSMKKFSKDIL